MTDAGIEVSAVEDVERSALQPLLHEYHRWMDDHAPQYDPATELAHDVSALESSGSWAWTARRDGTPAGCVLLHELTDDLAEFKRLWTSPPHRGHGVGRALLGTVVETAREEAYRTLGLTTPPWSEAAQALYESVGFERTDPYPETLLPERYHDDAVFMRLDLTDDGPVVTDA